MIYQFRCEQCGVVDAWFPMAEAPPVGTSVPCDGCGGEAVRIFSSINTDLVENVRYSNALKVHPDEVKDGSANRMHPGATFLNDGTMVIHNRKEKLQRMRERSLADGRNWVEQ